MRNQWACLLAVLLPLNSPSDLTGQAQCDRAPKRAEEVLGLLGSPVIFVETVVPHSAAEAAGISHFDLIVAFNGQNMRQFPTAESFLTELRVAAITDKAEIEVLKYDPLTGAYSPSTMIVSIAGSKERYIGLRSSFAYFVREVPSVGVADRIGITPGDFIEEVDGKQVSNLRGPIDLDGVFEDVASRPNHHFTLSVGRWTPTEDGGRKAKLRKLTGSL